MTQNRRRSLTVVIVLSSINVGLKHSLALASWQGPRDEGQLLTLNFRRSENFVLVGKKNHQIEKTRLD